MRRTIPLLLQQTRLTRTASLGFAKQQPSEEKVRTFNEIFSGLMKKVDVKSNDAIDVGNQRISYKKLMDQKTDTVDYPKVEESLAGTIEYMESIDNSYDLLKYCNEIVVKFDSNPTIAKLDLQAIKSTSDPSVPVLNQFTFPIIMKHGLMKLNDFRSPLDAITLFESLKSKSLHTFILGCGIKNYNKYIELQWSCFQDITKILNILEDLKINGIQGDLETEQILTTIKDEYADLLTEDSLTKSETFIWSERNEEDLKKLKKYIEDLSLYSSL